MGKHNIRIKDLSTGKDVMLRHGMSKKFVDNAVDQFCMGLRMYRVVDDFNTTNRARHLTVEGRMDNDQSYIREFKITVWEVL